jgi:hypothetical protein
MSRSYSRSVSVECRIDLSKRIGAFSTGSTCEKFVAPSPVVGTGNEWDRLQFTHSVGNQCVKKFLLGVAILVALLACGYWYWTTTPLYAFQEAAIALKNGDSELFYKRVDLTNFIDNLLDDLLIRPAASTPNLDSVQREVGNAALMVAKGSISAEALRSVDRLFARRRAMSMIGGDAAYAVESAPRASFGDALRAAGNEMRDQTGKWKTVVYSRMESWAKNHTNTLPGRLLACPANQRGEELKRVLSEYGLQAKNFKRISSYVTSSDGTKEVCKVALNFYSPKVQAEVPVEVEILKLNDCWKISRISNIPQLFVSLEEPYSDDMHALMLASLSGISAREVNSGVKNMTNRLIQNPAVQNFARQFNFNLGK